jgi:heptosyltransferase-2
MRLNDFLQERNIQTIFLTGPSEPELHNQLTTAGYDNIIGPNLPLREFAGVLSTLTVLVTADTFALHLALAFSTHVISLFGPTSHAEIELFGLGTKLLPDHECQCYYARQCTAEHNCLESIPPLRVMVETLKCID